MAVAPSPRALRARRPSTRQEAAKRLKAATEAMSTQELVALTVEVEEAAAGVAKTSKLTGKSLPPTKEIAEARRQNKLRAFAERQELLAETFTATEVATLLQAASRQTAHDLASAGKLLVANDRGRLRFPIWQFDEAAADCIVEGLPAVLAVLSSSSIDDLGRVRWFVRPNGLLDGRTPQDALLGGDVDAVVEAAAAIGAS